jgi:hypothetical protein
MLYTMQSCCLFDGRIHLPWLPCARDEQIIAALAFSNYDFNIQTTLNEVGVVVTFSNNLKQRYCCCLFS